MRCWDILGIAPTADKKSIKKAYAILLKKNKPDENPQGFSQLHAAYKQSLQAAASLASSILAPSNAEEPLPLVEATLLDSTAPIVETVEKITVKKNLPVAPEEQVHIKASLPETTVPVVQTIDTETIVADVNPDESHNDAVEALEVESRMAELMQAWQPLSAQVDAALELMKLREHVESWRFLENQEALYDIEFKAEFSEHVFGKLLEFFENNNVKLTQRSAVIRYLNRIFHWADYSYTLEAIYGSERAEVFVNYLSDVDSVQTQGLQWVLPKSHIGPIEYANYYKRIAATFVDWLICYVVASSMPVDSLAAFSAIIIAYLVVTPIMEATPLQGTPGKIFFGLKVVSPKGKRLNIFHALWRMLIFSLSTAGFKITVWINFFINDGRMLHDRLSYSVVINR